MKRKKCCITTQFIIRLRQSLKTKRLTNIAIPNVFTITHLTRYHAIHYVISLSMIKLWPRNTHTTTTTMITNTTITIRTEMDKHTKLFPLKLEKCIFHLVLVAIVIVQMMVNHFDTKNAYLRNEIPHISAKTIQTNLIDGLQSRYLISHTHKIGPIWRYILLHSSRSAPHLIKCLASPSLFSLSKQPDH